MKTIKDFKKAVKEKNITRWNVYKCLTCGYDCGFVIRKGVVFYDAGCSKKNFYIRKSWKDLTDYYNKQTSEAYIKKMNKFWGFDQE